MIYQLGRYATHVNEIIPATEPLEFHTFRQNFIGYGALARTPVLIGQMVPSWFKNLPNNKGININKAHQHLPNRRPHTMFVSAETPYELGNKYDNSST